MKNFKQCFLLLATFALVFTSCSKEEGIASDNEKASLSFGAILNDLAKNATAKQAEGDIPQCTDDAAAYVGVVLLDSNGNSVVGTINDPFEIDLVDGQVFTEEVPQLQLDPGQYTLDYFAVYNAAGDMIWLAPKNGGLLADYVQNALPLNISLGAGVKKYIDVSVLCYDNRDVNEYGYVFFDFDQAEIIDFCIFGNYCPPSGRHYPAAFTVNVWMYENGARGQQIHSNLSNSVALNNDGDYAGSTLCVSLPDTAADDEYYFEITFNDSDAYDDVTERVIRRGVITDEEVRSFFDGDDNLEYYHFRQGCGDDSPPIFENPEEGAEHYKACLYPENGSKAFGFAYFKLKGDILETTVLASNLEGGKMHPQHIHESADCNEPGLPILALDKADGSWPVAQSPSGDIVYHRTFTLGDNGNPSSSQIDLANRSVNLKGMTVGGEYVMESVVACGELLVQDFD